MTTAPTIVRIIAVRDTRSYEEVGDRWVAIPGSGNARECDRCGRDHEIHVDVELSNGATAVIGQGCARGESMDVQSRVKSAVSAAMTRARLAAEFGRAARKLATSRAICEMVAQLAAPPVVLLEEMPDKYERGMVRVYGMGDARQWVYPGSDFNYVAQLEHSWRRKREEERGVRSPVYAQRQAVSSLAERLDKIERKIAQMTRQAATSAARSPNLLI